MFVKVRIGLS